MTRTVDPPDPSEEPTQARVAALAGLNQRDYDSAVMAYLSDRDRGPADDAVFRSPELLTRTHETVVRLRAVAGQALNRPGRASDDQRRTRIAFDGLSVEKQILDPLVRAARPGRPAGQVDHAPRRRAYRELAARHPEEFSAIRNAIADGEDPPPWPPATPPSTPPGT